MFIIIAIVVIIALILMFIGNNSEPNVENFTLHQMNRHVTNLQNWINTHRMAYPNPSDSMKAKIQKKEAQLDHAMAVWKRKNEEATKSTSLTTTQAATQNEMELIADMVNQLVDEGMKEPEAISVALKEWHESSKSQ